MFKLEVIYDTIAEVAHQLQTEEPEVFRVEEKEPGKYLLLHLTMPDESKRAMALAAYRYTSPSRAIRNQDAVMIQATNAPRKIVPYDLPDACKRSLPQIIREYYNAQKEY